MLYWYPDWTTSLIRYCHQSFQVTSRHPVSVFRFAPFFFRPVPVMAAPPRLTHPFWKRISVCINPVQTMLARGISQGRLSVVNHVSAGNRVDWGWATATTLAVALPQNVPRKYLKDYLRKSAPRHQIHLTATCTVRNTQLPLHACPKPKNRLRAWRFLVSQFKGSRLKASFTLFKFLTSSLFVYLGD